MKAEELMIGDWLFYKVEQITKKKVGYHAEPCENRIHYLILSECDPIPLTPEILEKNGFKMVLDINKLPTYRIKWTRNPNLYFTIFTGVDGYWNPVGFGVTIGGVNGEVDYVHQLQHALRICRINKEIVL